MPGFYVSNLADIELINRYPEGCVSGSIQQEGFTVKRHTLNRFLNDKLFCADGPALHITEGVVLNKQDLSIQHNCTDFSETVQNMYKKSPDCFFADFRGSFSGAIFDKAGERWNFYTNHYGDKPLFYYFKDGRFAVGSQVNYILDALRTAKVPLTLNEKAIYFMLTYGFMEDDSTYACEIKRLPAGHHLVIDRDGLRIQKYYTVGAGPETLTNVSEADIIERLDGLFREAVRLEYEKDLEYGYQHLTDISGGLDSRMNTWVAHNMGYTSITNISYSQSDSTDDMVAKQVASSLGTEYIYRALDDAGFMKDLDEIISMNYGLALYSGITGGNSLLRALNMSRFGLEHTGQVGDVIIGAWRNKAEPLKYERAGFYSTRLVNRLGSFDCSSYQDSHDYLFRVRAFNGALSTHMIRQNYTEVASPFLNIEFFEFCMSIPTKLRAEHRLYKKWILSKYPEAGRFIWEKSGCKIGASDIRKKITKILKKGFPKALKIIGIPIRKPNGMNPMDYWLRQNPSLREYWETYFDENIQNPLLREELRNDISVMFREGSAMEKTQALTALGALRFYFK